MAGMKSLMKITAAACAVLACLLLTSCDPVLSLNQKYAYTDFTLELGEDIPASVEDYIDMSSLSEEDAEFVHANTSILYDGSKTREKSFDDPGDHTLTIMYKDHQYRKYNIRITDNEPPVFTRSTDLYTFETIPLEKSQIKKMFKAEDNSGHVKVTTDKTKVDYDKAGKYKITAKAVDSSGNEATAEAYIIVQKPEYGAKGTYVYVSIPDQHLTYFVDGEPVLECPVVTGNTLSGNSTPSGTFRILNMGRNVTLKGRENNGKKYVSHVSYWMAFLGAEYGLHDAPWRGVFGGSIYQGGGSHGCVNMPPHYAAELYDMVDIGTLVFVY